MVFMSEQKLNDTKLDGLADRLFDEFPWPTYEEWRSMVEKQLKGVPFEQKLITHTYEGIDIQPIYRQEDGEKWPHLASMPGYPPYVRGATALGHNRKPWAISQELPYRTPAEFNRAIRTDLERGQTVINLVFDKATLFGLDPDNAQVGDVGRGGVSIATIEDLEIALRNIDLERVPIFIQASSSALPLTALLMALIRREGKSTTKIRGCIGMDSLHTLVRAGAFPRSLRGAYDRMANLMIWAKENAPKVRTVNIHSQPYHDGGGSAAQELAFSLATGVEYVRELLLRNLEIDDITQRMCFSFSVGSNFFMEVAKLRAARLLWAKIVQTFGGNEISQQMSIQVRTSSWNKTIYDPYVNMLRTTVEAFAGVVGGADSMHVGTFDEPLGLPDEFSRRIARNSQLILQHEAHLHKVVDPAGGSWYVETLTDSLARSAWNLFQQVEAKGGMGKALKQGFPQAQVAKTYAERIANIATRKDVFIGTNVYPNLGEKPLEVMQIDYEDLHARRASYVSRYRTSLDNASNTIVMHKLSAILEAKNADSIEASIEAALAGATLGEIAQALRAGDDKIITAEPIPATRGTDLFESLRAASDVHAVQTGFRPQVFLANLGPIPQHKARADFATDFFQVGGFKVISNDGFTTVTKAAQAAVDSGAPIVIICSSDDVYPKQVPRLARAIKKKQPGITLMLAGRPRDADLQKEYTKAGVDDFIFNGMNVYQKLLSLQQKLGII
jgi:methylmalonyl-CoA mutase